MKWKASLKQRLELSSDQRRARTLIQMIRKFRRMRPGAKACYLEIDSCRRKPVEAWCRRESIETLSTHRDCPHSLLEDNPSSG
jgi:hypothetical protein